MDFIPDESKESNGLIQLLKLLAFSLLSAVCFSLLAIFLVYIIYGTIEPKNLGSMRIMLVATSLGLFLVPSLILPISEKSSITTFYGFKKVKPNLLLLTILLIVVSMPFLEWTVAVNEKMVLPDALKWVEDWMRQKEEETKTVTLMLLDMKNISDLIVNLLMIAVIPAIAEELIFRGALQRSLTKIFHNPHVAIWMTAFIFSAIHFQFFGFLPRFLMGAAFGYLYFWSGSLWYAMIAHFLNNAYAVCIAWYMQKNNIPLSEADQMHFTWYGYVLSFMLAILIFQVFKKQTNK